MIGPMPKVEAIVTIMVDKRIVEAECSLCHDVIFAHGRADSTEDQESQLREAINKHARQRHSEGSE
jgi:hypothetical protein